VGVREVMLQGLLRKRSRVGKGRTLVSAIDTHTRNAQPPQIGILLALKAGRQIALP
jgi:hypothetical protein